MPYKYTELNDMGQSASQNSTATTRLKNADTRSHMNANETKVMVSTSTDPSCYLYVENSQDLLSLEHSSKPVVMVFTAQWCGWCKKLKPELQKLINSTNPNTISLLKNLRIVHFDTSLPFVSEWLRTKSWTIPGYPALYSWNGQEACDAEEMMIEGPRTEENLVRAFQQLQPHP